LDRTRTGSTALPDYVQERNTRAATAGLIVEKQHVNASGRMTSWYRGTPEQFVRAGIAGDERSLQRATSCFSNAIRVFSPLRHAYHATLHRLALGELRLIVANERLPIETAVIKGSIRVYWYERGWAHRPTLIKVFVANTRTELVAAGVAPRAILSMDSDQYVHGRGARSRRETLWRIDEHACGCVLYQTYPAAMAKAAAARPGIFLGSERPVLRIKELERAKADDAFQAFLQRLQGKSSDII
jgi:hypothetical protein